MHVLVVGANGQRQAMFLENVQGFGAVLWRNFVTTPGDCLLAISTSGCNAVTVDVALEAKRMGMFVVALTIPEAWDDLPGGVPAIVGDTIYIGSGTSSSDACRKPANDPLSEVAFQTCIDAFNQTLGTTGAIHALRLLALP